MQIIVAIVGLALFLFQLAAFQQGMEEWLGLHWVLSTFIGIVLVSLPFGSIASAAIAFYGITAGWGWEWWQALLLLFPFVGVALVLGAAEGIGGIVGRLRRGQ